MAWNNDQFKQFLQNLLGMHSTFISQLGDTQEQDEKTLEELEPFLERDKEFARRLRETISLNQAFQMHRLELVQYLKGKVHAPD